MDRYSKEFLKMMRKDSQMTKTIIILVLILLILFMPVLFIILGGPQKIAQMRKTEKPVSENVEKIATGLSIGAEEAVGTTAEAELLGSDTRIDDMIAISELQTLEYRYNAICRIDDSSGSPVYYIAYEATVQLGIEIDDITIDYGSEDDKVITVVLPEVQILSTNVDAGSMDYIFVDEAYNDVSASVQAQSFCEEHLISRVREDENMFASARENTEAEIEALTQPLVDQFYPDYQLVVVWGV